MKFNKIFGIFLGLFLGVSICSQEAFAANDLFVTDSMAKQYKKVTKDERLILASETLKGTIGDYSRRAILGNNLTGKPIKLEFRDLSALNPKYAEFDALGWKQRGKLHIFINIKHQNAPKEALAAVLSHEAIHQDELNSINEETYCWTLEAAVWTQLTDTNPELENAPSALVTRENTIKKMFLKGNYTNKFIRKSILSNAGYQGLPSRSPGFEEDL